MKNVIINGKVILEDSIKELNVFFENGKITEVSNRVPTDETVIDAKGLYVAPGMIDVHTHGRNGSDTMYATFKDLNNISVSYLRDESKTENHEFVKIPSFIKSFTILFLSISSDWL